MTNCADLFGAVEFGVRLVVHVRVHFGFYDCVRGDGCTACGLGIVYAVQLRRWRTLLDSLRMRPARGRPVRDVRGGRPLAPDGTSRRTVRTVKRNGVRGQRDGHVPRARARRRARSLGRGYGVVPGVPAGCLPQTRFARRPDVALGRRSRGRGRGVRVHHHVRHVVLHGPGRRRPGIIQRLGLWTARVRPQFTAEFGVHHRHYNNGYGVFVLQRRRHLDYHQVLRRLENRLGLTVIFRVKTLLLLLLFVLPHDFVLCVCVCVSCSC